MTFKPHGLMLSSAQAKQNESSSTGCTASCCPSCDLHETAGCRRLCCWHEEPKMCTARFRRSACWAADGRIHAICPQLHSSETIFLMTLQSICWIENGHKGHECLSNFETGFDCNKTLVQTFAWAYSAVLQTVRKTDRDAQLQDAVTMDKLQGVLPQELQHDCRADIKVHHT